MRVVVILYFRMLRVFIISQCGLNVHYFGIQGLLKMEPGNGDNITEIYYPMECWKHIYNIPSIRLDSQTT